MSKSSLEYGVKMEIKSMLNFRVEGTTLMPTCYFCGCPLESDWRPLHNGLMYKAGMMKQQQQQLLVKTTLSSSLVYYLMAYILEHCAHSTFTGFLA